MAPKRPAAESSDSDTSMSTDVGGGTLVDRPALPSPSQAREHDEDTGRQRTRQQGGSGHIESIELIDFMCHRHLLVKFNAHINFVLGNNGSGKSAILTALTVALGGRASATQRATSVDSLIREGASSAKVRVKLFNGGDNPYQESLYGEHIVIERSFKRGGATSYCILAGTSGKGMASRREEVNLICDHFGLQVDNPLAVLTQETAKKFLASAKPKELYEFFMKATQLEQLSIDYAFTLEKIKESKARLEQSKGALQPLRDSIGELERQLADLERLRETHQRIQQLRAELTWAIIEQREGEVEKQESSVSQSKGKVGDIGEKIVDYEANLQKLIESIASAETSLATENDRMKPLLQRRTALGNDLRMHEHGLADCQMDAQIINSEFGALRTQMEGLQRRLDEERAKGGGDGGDDDGSGDHGNRQQRARLAALEGEIVTLNAQIAGLCAVEGEHNKQLEELQQKTLVISNKKGEAERQLETHKNSLETAERSKGGDRVRGFGERMGEALAEIKSVSSKPMPKSASSKHSASAANSQHFSRPPIGPVGLFVNVRDARWALALEAILHTNLEAFIVNDHRDRGILQQILAKYSFRNPIVVVRFEGELDITRGTPDASLLTALDVLDIEDAVVRKMLIIMSQIESQVLIEDRLEAMRVMRQRPRNVHAIYTCTARLNAGARTISVTQLFPNPKRFRLAEDVAARIQELRKKVSEGARAVSVLHRDLDKTREEWDARQASLRQVATEVVTAERRLRQVKSEIRDIHDELDEGRTVPSVTSTSESLVALFEQERKELETRMSSLGAQFQANSAQQGELQLQKAATAEELLQVDEQISQLRANSTRQIEEVAGSVRLRRSLERDIESLRQARQVEEGELPRREQALREARQSLSEMTEAALRVCSRVSTARSVSELDRDLSAHEECVRLNQGSRLDAAKVKEDLTAKRGQHREAERSIVINERLVRSLGESLEQRQRAWIEFRKSVSKMSSTEFIFMLNARGFRGSLEYRHHDAELHIRVIPQGQPPPDQMSSQRATIPSQGRGGSRRAKRGDGRIGGGRGEHLAVSDEPAASEGNRDVRQLSGGEKSYSTACFLFSLWQAMGSPLRCLDEFDVYMDPINRAFVLELLVGHARASRVQFILITPNAIPETYRTAADVTIYRLRDPERGQTALA